MSLSSRMPSLIPQSDLYVCLFYFHSIAPGLKHDHGLKWFREEPARQWSRAPVFIKIYMLLGALQGFLGDSAVKNPPAMQETQETRVQSLDWEDPLEKEMATHPSTVAWEIPWTEEPGGLQSTGLQRVRHDWAHTHRNIAGRKDSVYQYHWHLGLLTSF